MRGTPIRALCVGLLVAGCSGEPPERGGASPSARRDIVETLREDDELERHPADGGGRAWLEESDGQPPSAVAGLPGRWTVVYEAGPLGVAEGGWVFFQAPPFWNWSTPQIFDPQLPGYTEVSSEAEGVELEPATVDPQLLAIQVRGRALRQGETVRMVYGAGPASPGRPLCRATVALLRGGGRRRRWRPSSGPGCPGAGRGSRASRPAGADPAFDGPAR